MTLAHLFTFVLTVLGCVGFALSALQAVEGVLNLTLYFFIVNLDANRLFLRFGFAFLVLDIVDVHLTLLDALTFALFALYFTTVSLTVLSRLFLTLFALFLLLFFGLGLGMGVLVE